MAKPTLSKRNAEDFPIGFRYHPPDLESAETISTCTVAVSPTGLNITTPATISDNQVSSRIYGGLTATEYIVTFTMTTSSSKIFVDEWIVNVE